MHTVQTPFGPMLTTRDGVVTNSVSGLEGVYAVNLLEHEAHYGRPAPAELEIYDVGYWHIAPGGVPAYEPPDGAWRQCQADAELHATI